MKNIQIIDSSINCVYDIFSATDREFHLIFPYDTNIAFIEEVYANGDEEELDKAFNKIWTRPVLKNEVQGIHGTVFYGLEEKKIFYPSRRDEEAVNPDGTLLR